MSSPHELLNRASTQEARALLLRCCGSQRWADAMLAVRPYQDSAALLAAAERSWAGLHASDYLEAFACHPRIGEDLALLRQRFSSTASWSSQEQAAVAGADEATLLALQANNGLYARRFGFIFIVCATGKSAGEILSELERRLNNPPEQELALAAREQASITRLRLEKLTP